MTEPEEVPVIVKRKKGRPRLKDSNGADVINEKGEPKKRGRKKKEIVVEEKPKERKKRGRKPAQKYLTSDLRKKIPINSNQFQTEYDTLIHLDIKSKDLVNDDKLSFSGFNNLSDDENIDLVIETDFEKISTSDLLKNKIKQRLFDDSQKKKNLEDIYDDSDMVQKVLEQINNQERLFDTPTNRVNNQDIPQKFEKSMGSLSTLVKNLSLQPERKVEKVPENTHSHQIIQEIVNAEKWPETTNICCFWCCHSFETVPLGLPIRFSAVKNKFETYGIFCSFSCMISYVGQPPKFINYNIKYTGGTEHNIKILIRSMYVKLTGANLLKDVIQFSYPTVTPLNTLGNIICPAPPREILTMFGGELSITEFRSRFNENRVFKMINYPLIPRERFIVEAENKTRQKSNIKHHRMKDINVQLNESKISEVKTRLERSKPLPNSFNTMDLFLSKNQN